MHSVAVIVGSLRRESINRRLAGALEKLAEGKLTFQWVEIGDLPLFNQDREDEPTEAVQRMKAQVNGAAGILLVTPEHNRSIPAAMKNVVDWGTRPRGQNAWLGKPAAIIGTSRGNIGTALAQQHLRTIVAAVGLQVMAHPEAFITFRDDAFGEDGTVTNETTRAFLQGFIDRFAAWIDRFA